MSAPVRQWLDAAGSFPVEHIPCDTHFPEPVNLDGPRTGVLHTTEGSFEASLAIFKQHFAPHFLVGVDSTGKVRIAQLVAIGMIGAALVAHNAAAIVQIEVVAFSKEQPYIFDDATLGALAALMATIEREYSVPLTRPFVDGDYGRAGDNPHRHAGKWGVIVGWYAHGDAPSPDNHWDVGNLQWGKLLAAAGELISVRTAPAWTPPQQPPARPCSCAQPLSYTPPQMTVSQIQAALKVFDPAIVVDGDLGPQTLAAIKLFQRLHNLPVDGIAGPQTQAALLAGPPPSRQLIG